MLKDPLFNDDERKKRETEEASVSAATSDDADKKETAGVSLTSTSVDPVSNAPMKRQALMPVSGGEVAVWVNEKSRVALPLADTDTDFLARKR